MDECIPWFYFLPNFAQPKAKRDMALNTLHVNLCVQVPGFVVTAT